MECQVHHRRRWRRQRHPPQRRHRDAGAIHPGGDEQRVLEGRPLALSRDQGSGGLPHHVKDAGRAGFHHPEHQWPRPLADGDADRPGKG